MFEKQLRFLKGNFERGGLAHAYLFSGQDIESIKSFTKEFIKLINSKAYEVMIENGSFPDLLVVRSEGSKSSLDNEKDMMEIDITQIRNAQNFLAYKAYYGNFKAVIIENAERMNAESQSCLLKTLEEPRGKTIIFLLTSKPDILLPTVLSRCQHLKFQSSSSEISKEEELILHNLKKVINSNLAEKFNYAKSVNLDGENFKKVLGAMQKYFRQIMMEKLSGQKGKELTAGDLSIEKIAKLLRLADDLNYKSHFYNINNKLALEMLLLEL